MKKYLLFTLFVFIIIQKNLAQKYIWAFDNNALGTVSKDLKLDKNKNIYILGIFNGPVNYNGTILNGFGGNDIFLAKYDSSGNFIWVIEAGGTLNDFSSSMAIDDSGNVYTAGSYLSSISFDSLAINFSGKGYFVSKYNTNGDIVWAKSAACNYSSISNGIYDDPYISISPNTDVYFYGNFIDSIHFDSTTLYTPGNAKLFLAKFDRNGNFKWVKENGGVCEAYSTSMAVDSSGNVFINGLFNNSDSISFDTILIVKNGAPSFGNNFIAKYDSSGSIKFAKSVLSSNYSESSYSKISVDKNQNIFLGASTISSTFNTGGFGGFYLIKYDNSGNQIWMSDTSQQQADEVPICQLVIDNQGSIYITGTLSDTTNFYGTFFFDSNVLIAKFDSQGQAIWARSSDYGRLTFAGSGSGIYVDNLFNVFLTGIYIDSIKFDQFILSTNLTNNISFIVKIEQSGINYLNPIITNFNSATEPSFTDNRTTSIISDTIGNIYSGSISGGITFYNISNSTWSSFNTSNSSIPSDSISNLFLDKDSNNVWICTFDKGIIKFDTVTWPNINTSTNPSILSNHITCGEIWNDTIFLGTELNDVVITDGVVWFDSYFPTTPGKINSIIKDKVGNLWIATNDSGLIKVNTNSVTNYNYNNSFLPDNSVQSLAIDKNNKLWLGTRSNGIASLDNANWKMYNSFNSILPDNNILSIVAGPSGNILVGTQSKGIGVFNDSVWSIINGVSGLPDSNVTSIIYSQGVYWGGLHDYGVVKFHPDSTIPVAIEKIFNKYFSDLICYPNPFNSRIVLSYSLNTKSEVKINLLDIMGKYVFEKKLGHQMPGKYELLVDGISLPDGIYLIQLLTNEGYRTSKVIVSH